ncbi:MAG TPA: hypothetical protein DD706_09270 [Nitrospiraceae bacterium]|nr:hypothetical protein [Nitrospiraceae bacterium]
MRAGFLPEWAGLTGREDCDGGFQVFILLNDSNRQGKCVNCMPEGKIGRTGPEIFTPQITPCSV